MRIHLLFVTALLSIGCNNSADKKKSEEDTVKIVNQMPPLPVRKDTLLHAVGTEPFWFLYVINHTKIIFHPADGADVEVPFVEPEKVDSLTYKYTSANDKITMELMVKKHPCSDGMSEKQYPYTIGISLNAVKYKGCGEE